MNIHDQIKKALQGLTTPQMVLPLDCTVTAVEGASCTVKLVSGLEVPDVRLRATLADATDEFIVIPKVGTKAVVWSMAGDLSDLTLIKCDQLECIRYQQGAVVFEVNSDTGKVTITNGQHSLKSLMNDLHDILTNLVVLTPNGPSAGLHPNTVAALSNFSTAFNNLLND